MGLRTEPRVEEDGIYLCRVPDNYSEFLTDVEYSTLIEHPTGKSKAPVLTFPFSLCDLSDFLDWAQSVGHDFPINEDGLKRIIESNRRNVASHAYEVSCQSDQALGAYTRERHKEFANKNVERSQARAQEHQRWRDCAENIRKSREKSVSKRHLALLVKNSLNLPDNQETIRKAL